MAGHSHWAGIKHRKGRADKQRSKIFSKLSKEITVAAKLGSKAPEMNPRLRTAIQAARSSNMPKDNIDRAINKSEVNKSANYNSLVYEGFGPEKIAIIIEALTDNKNRTASNIRTIFQKYGGNLGESGVASHQFKHEVFIRVDKKKISEDSILEISINAGAEDFDVDEENFIVKTDPLEVMNVRKNLEDNGYKIDSAKVEMLPKNLHKIDKDKSEKAIILLEAIEDHEDIKSVYTNLDF